MTLAQHQRQAICQKIVYDINDRQCSDHYSFGDELDITWSSKDEAYRIIPAKGKKTWATPRDLILYIQDLSDTALIEYYVEDTSDLELEELQ